MPKTKPENVRRTSEELRILEELDKLIQQPNKQHCNSIQQLMSHLIIVLIAIAITTLVVILISSSLVGV